MKQQQHQFYVSFCLLSNGHASIMVVFIIMSIVLLFRLANRSSKKRIGNTITQSSANSHYFIFHPIIEMVALGCSQPVEFDDWHFALRFRKRQIRVWRQVPINWSTCFLSHVKPDQWHVDYLFFPNKSLYSNGNRFFFPFGRCLPYD